MTYTPVRTDDGIEIRDNDDVVAQFNTWPPRDPDGLEDFFDDADISQPNKSVFRILFGVEELVDERTDTDHS